MKGATVNTALASETSSVAPIRLMEKQNLMKIVLVLLIALLPCPALVAQRFEKDGMVVQFSVRPLVGKAAGDKAQTETLLEDSSAIVTFTVSDSRTNQPVTGLHPAAWISARKAETPPDAAKCGNLIRSFLAESPSSEAELDLSSYLLLTLNYDHTVAFINPRSGFGAKLKGLVTLYDTGADWVFGPTKEFLYITVPGQSSVAVIDTFSARLLTTIPLGENTMPRRLAIQPDGRYLWVALDGTEEVAAINIADNLVRKIPTGRGTHRFAFMPDSTRVFVTNSDADTVSILDTDKLVKVAEVNISLSPGPIAYSRASNLVYVAASKATVVSVIDPVTRKTRSTIPSKPGIVDLQFAPGGRFGFLINQSDNTLSVFDSATDKIVATAAVDKSPDQIAFTHDYAYVRSNTSEKLALFELSKLPAGKLQPVSVVAGLKPPNESPSGIGIDKMIAPGPEGNSVFIANAADQMIYYYVEGMAAPMGTLSNYKRYPQAVLVLDRSVSEVAPGKYSTMIRVPRSGMYDVPFLLDQPRLITCFTLEVRSSSAGR